MTAFIAADFLREVETALVHGYWVPVLLAGICTVVGSILQVWGRR